MKIINIQQNTPSWLAWRKEKIGASDSPIIMGESPWCTPFQLWERKLGFIPDQVENSSMSRGKRLEHEARSEFMKMKNIIVCPEVIQHATNDWMIASLDGLSVCQKFAVEIKCPGYEDHLSALKGNVPKKYYSQMQHQIAVSGLDMIYYFSYDGLENALIEVLRDQEYIDAMILKERNFLECLRSCIPPQLGEDDYNPRYDSEWCIAVKKWKLAKEIVEASQREEEKARKELIDCCHSMNSKGEGVKVQKIMRKGVIDYSKIDALDGVDLENFRKPSSESWRITLDGS